MATRQRGDLALVSADDFLNRLLDDLDNDRLVLPTLPEVALQVREAVESEDANAARIASIIGTDAALSGRLLQVANSPLYRGSREIDSLQQAIARLGNGLIRNIVVSLVMQQMFQATNDLLDRWLREVWEHSTQVAAISRALASQVNGLQPDHAMLAGLLHDIGVLPILMQAEEYEELLDDEQALGQVVADLHTQVGTHLLRDWGLAESLVAVAAEHEDITRDPGGKPDYVDIVIVANLQSHYGTQHRLADVDWSQVPAFRRLGFQPDVSEVEIEETSVEEVQQLFSA